MCGFSFRSDYDPLRYNGTEGGKESFKRGERGGEAGGGTSVETFSFSDLPRLDYGSGDEREMRRGGGGGFDEHSRDQVALALRELSTASRCGHMTVM